MGLCEITDDGNMHAPDRQPVHRKQFLTPAGAWRPRGGFFVEYRTMSDTRNIIDINTSELVGTIEMTDAQFIEYAEDCGDTGATTPLQLLAYGENLQLVSAEHMAATVYVEG
jgi:hypothetical protein